MDPQYYAGNPMLYDNSPLLYSPSYRRGLPDPLAPFTLPTGPPPLAGRNRHRRFKGRRPEQVVIQNSEHVPQPHPYRGSYSDDGNSTHSGRYDDTLTDVESDVSDAVSGDSFTFDCSPLEPLEQPTEDTASSTIVTNTYPIDASKPEKPSPYVPANLCVWQSRFVGDPLQQWDGSAVLSASNIPINPKQQASGLFKWIHLESQHHNFAAFSDYISSLPDLTGIESEHAVALTQLLRQRSEHSIPTAEATKGKYLDSNMTTWPPSLRSSQGKEAGRVHFLCLPYFTLESYAAHQYSNTSDTHPTRSLLQTQYPSAAMERDLQQAICHIQPSDQRLCYHVPQIWCLYVENTLTLDFESDYYVTYIGVVQKPENWQRLLSLAKKQPLHVILHSRCNSRKRRRGSGSSKSSSEDDSPILTHDDSPTVIGSHPIADHIQNLFNSEMTDTERKKKKSTAFETDTSANTAGTKTQDVWVDDFHLFYWLAAVSKLPKVTGRPTTSQDIPQKGISLTVDNRQMKNRMSQIQDYLTQKNHVGRAYALCPTSGLDEVEARKEEISRLAKGNISSRRGTGMSGLDEVLEKGEGMRGRRRSISQGSKSRSPRRNPSGRLRDRRRPTSEESRRSPSLPRNPSLPRRSAYTIHIDGFHDSQSSRQIVRLAKQIFTFFFPLEYSSRMTGKYWGAVRQLLDNQLAVKDFDYNHIRDLRRLRSSVQPLARLLRYGPSPGMIDLPIELSRAWIHLLGFWLLAATKRSTRTVEAELDKCCALLESGAAKLLRMRASHPLHYYEAAVPSGVVSLLVNKLAGDAASGSSDIETTYYSFVTKIEQEVQQKPYSRSHQERITAVRQEISCVLAVLEDQKTSTERLRSAVMRGKIDGPPGFPQRRESYILQNCLASIDDRIQNFRALDERARGIAAFNLYRIESNRDRQEGAILVFTIVTIIFLPLSFVSSFFGMNTSDIRDMATPQWAFWASAVPLTAIVVGVSIFVARKIEPVKDWWSSLSDRWRVKSGNGMTGNVFPAPGLAVQQPPVQRMASGFAPPRQTRSYAWVESGRPRRRQTGGLQYRGYA
ncbi:MAG: hypothetical protein Q9216_004676 [Gyalolechia sp. 2 TL-2023]